MAISNKMSILGTKKAVMAYNGGYYLPSVSDEGILSWSPTVEGMAPIPEVNVRGPQGEVGPVGPRGEKGDKGDSGLTSDQLELLTAYASAEGRNIPISEDGEIVTQIGHTYTITAGEQAVKCTDADFNPLCEVAAHKQIAFVAPTTAAYVDNATCTVTEVFRSAAPVELSGNGGGEPTGDYVTLDANGCITSGRLDTLVDGSYLQYGKKLTEWDIALPALSKGDNMFTFCHLSKSSTLTILDSLPAHFDEGIHRLMLKCQSVCETDSDVQNSIENAKNRGWEIIIFYDYSDQLPLLYTKLEYLESTGTQFTRVNAPFDNTSGLYCEYSNRNTSIDTMPIGTRYNNLIRLYIPHQYSSMWYVGWIDWIPIVTADNSNNILGIASTNFLNCRRAVIDFLGTRLNYELKAQIDVASSSHPYTLFADSNASIRFLGRVYNAKISHGESVIHNFIPCLDPTGAPCMYDIVSRTALYNQGSDDFIYPTESTTYSLRRVLPDWGKLTENGLRRLYHAPAGYQGELYDYAIENGYKPIVEPEMPTEGYWTPQWRETEEEIVLDWIETEIPEMEEPENA